MAWRKYGSQPIHDVKSNVNSGDLNRTQPEPAYTAEPTPVLISTVPPGITSVPFTPTSTISTEQLTATPQRTDRIPTQPVLKMLRTAQTEQTSVLDTISPVSKTRPKDCQRPLFKIGGITIKNNLNEFVRVSVQVRFIKRIHPF